jgi:hypothetical protein
VQSIQNAASGYCARADKAKCFKIFCEEPHPLKQDRVEVHTQESKFGIKRAEILKEQ